DLYSFAPSEVIAAAPRGGLTLVHALPGIVDAGNSCRIAAAYLKDSLRHVRLVTFDADELIDYRGSRPQAVFDGVSYTSVEIPEVALYLMYDEADRPFLLLDGPEPDLQWRRFSQAIIDLVEFFEVDRVVSMHAIPMAVPHTRPIGLIAHANDPSLLDASSDDDAVRPDMSDQDTEIIVPASFSALLERELGRAEHAALGYAAQIPHYLTRSDFPAGALALLRRVSTATGLELPLVELGDLTDAASNALSESLSDNEEVGGIVTTLEQQYDAMRDETGGAGIATTMDMPTADEIGDHFERFLARHDDDDGESTDSSAP
ncbi:MAG: PAC2 family protein, partial [Brachybacterium sp.]|nr:PAC2 family protein [Brachybacterium sp.]